MGSNAIVLRLSNVLGAGPSGEVTGNMRTIDAHDLHSRRSANFPSWRDRLNDYDTDWMCDRGAGNGFDDHGNVRLVYSVLSQGFMPPDSAWPQDWLDTYQHWIDDGFQA